MDEYPELASLQKKMSTLVNIPNGDGYFPKQNDVILALDIQYQEDNAHVGGDLLHWEGEPIATLAGVSVVDTPYVPSYFCFREGPPLLAFLSKLKQQGIADPDLIIVDGHGLAHPRFFGVACWLGVATGKPIIGMAKESLLHWQGELAPERGSRLDVFCHKEKVGYVLRTQDGVKPVYVSPGHLVGLEASAEIILGLPAQYRIPEPLRNADHAAREHCKGVNDSSWQELGEIPAVSLDFYHE